MLTWNTDCHTVQVGHISAAVVVVVIVGAAVAVAVAASTVHGIPCHACQLGCGLWALLGPCCSFKDSSDATMLKEQHLSLCSDVLHCSWETPSRGSFHKPHCRSCSSSSSSKRLTLNIK